MNRTAENQDLGPPEVLDGARQNRSMLRRPVLVLGLIVIALICLWRCKAEKTNLTDVRQVSKPSVADAERISVESSASYTEKLEEYAEQKAVQAKERGQSFVTPISQQGELRAGSFLPAPRKEKDKPSVPETQSVEKQPKQTEDVKKNKPAERPKQERKRDHSHAHNLAQSLDQLLSYHPVGPQALLILNQPRRHLPAHISSQERQQKNAFNELKAGDVLTCVNRITLTSDAPGPAMVEVVTGPLTGAKLMGSFVTRQERLTLTFTKLIRPDGKILPLLAYAVDPKTVQTALASHVDRHYFERFAGLIAASFLEGFGDAQRRSGQNTYSSLYGTSSQTQKYDLGEEAIIAAGKVGERTVKILESAASRPPTVTLEAGIDLAVLICEVTNSKTVEP